MQRKCKCGKILIFTREPKDRKKYCSKKCFYKYRVRPSGLKYILKNVNPTSFKKGNVPWNNGLAGKGICKPNNGSIKKGEHRGIKTEFRTDLVLGNKNFKWKGENVGYYALHSWVDRNLTRKYTCQHCLTKQKRTEWANKSHKYKRELTDWLELCKKCHAKYDKSTWGYATRRFNLNKK